MLKCVNVMIYLNDVYENLIFDDLWGTAHISVIFSTCSILANVIKQTSQLPKFNFEMNIFSAP